MTFPPHRFRCAADVLRSFPETTAVAFVVDGVTPDADVDAIVEPLLERVGKSSGERPSAETAATAQWRRALADSAVRPPDDDVHPLVAVCDAVARAHGIPIALFDLERVAGDIELRVSTGREAYIGESGAVTMPPRGEVVIVDEAGRALTRRWATRPSAIAAVRRHTRAAMVVACTPHTVAPADVAHLRRDVTTALGHHWSIADATAI